MNPINMLTASDVMRPGTDNSVSVSGTATPDTSLVTILDVMARQPGVVGVVDNGVVIGVITAQDIVAGLTRHRRV
jgi:glycine betaine/proline transport system ATP-binding protein